jgi:hypothetical protein
VIFQVQGVFRAEVDEVYQYSMSLVSRLSDLLSS